MLKALADTKVKDIDRPAPVTVGQDDTLDQVVARLVDHDRGGAIVCDHEGRVVGIFTQHDLLHRMNLEDPGWREVRVSQVMTPSPATARPDASLASVLHHMHRRRFRSMPVVDDAGRPVGAIAIRDILRHVAECFPEELLNLPPDPSLEARAPYGG